MVIKFKSGKIIVTVHEIVVKVASEHMITLSAQIDAIQLIGRGVNVIAANGSETKWSIKLDNAQQLSEIASEIGIDIQ
ncbi:MULTISPECIES: DUF3389 family protein [Vibrio]|uniref:DUF3389 family protein n=1 Tax=Vibrio TaxID=662 RepID=UPI002075D1D8|nr:MULTISPECIES: DUF3389 family protein [Vibrio]USD34181.1 DUF3389 domain-containing protein [Vibrio sp. SCSIO 43186]USD47253.1 DUF3389 domain-containing protein [Vibrio sp. SCSIO 43145]USD71305.1 DUF3389 domain-containing protein [Vibrio sp. SCSIO 43139]USD98219.1 PTS sugar transporter subunit IIA [Vibrio coralliilyticus]